MNPLRTAFLHYTAPPVVGGVEAVIEAHAQIFIEAGYPVTIIAGQGEQDSLPRGARLVLIPEMDSQDPQILSISAELAEGHVPEGFAAARDRLIAALRPALAEIDVLIVHNVLTKHFNLPLTAALAQLQTEGAIPRFLAWCHDFTWTSPNSRSQVHEGAPWDLLRTAWPGVQYVTISEFRQKELAGMLNLAETEVKVAYNGVDPQTWFSLSPDGWSLIRQMDLLAGDLILLMPVRVTQAKNIELAARVAAEIKARACCTRMVVTGPPDPHSASAMAYYRGLLDLRGELGLAQELRFVFEAGEAGDLEGHTISQQVVADLMRVSDVVFMPSHREGFGMPVLEAGLLGVPVVASERVPAALELGAKNVYLFNNHADPKEIARLILDEATNSRPSRFRRQVRQNFTWERIFKNQILPLLKG